VIPQRIIERKNGHWNFKINPHTSLKNTQHAAAVLPKACAIGATTLLSASVAETTVCCAYTTVADKSVERFW
jgi:hypothetical protein